MDARDRAPKSLTSIFAADRRSNNQTRSYHALFLNNCLVDTFRFSTAWSAEVIRYSRSLLRFSSLPATTSFSGEYLANLFSRPVNLLLGDDQRRGNADNMVVGFLAEEPAVFQLIAVLAGAAGLG